MANAKQGDRVKVHYDGKLDDGTVFDSSDGREPLEFTIGQHQLIPGFEDAVVGMEPGDSKETHIAADEAYGPYHENLVVQIGRENFPPEIKPELGALLQLKGADEEPVLVTIVDFNDEAITLDANHPLAGKDLNFTIRLVEIA